MAMMVSLKNIFRVWRKQTQFTNSWADDDDDELPPLPSDYY